MRIGVVFPMAKLKAGHLTMFPHGFLWVHDNPYFYFPNMQLVDHNSKAASLRVHFLANASVDFCLKAGPSALETEACVVGMNSFVNSRVPRGDAMPDGPPHACSGVATPGLWLNHSLEVGRVQMSLTFFWRSCF